MRYSGSRFDRGGFSVPGGRLTLSVFFLVLVAILLLFVHRADSSLFERWRTRVVDFSAPVLETLSWPVNAIRNGLTDLGEFWDVYEENRRLKKEIADLKVWQSAALHYESQIARYERLMQVQPQPGIEYVTARLIADGGSPFKHTFILNAGKKQGISHGQGVVDGLDLIGRVVNVGQSSSRVLRVTDINSRIPVMVEPTRQRAIMAGDNSSLPKLEFVQSELDIRPGDRVVTSGDGGLLPPGLPIGEVVQKEAGKFRVKPRTGHNRFEAVRVVRFNFPVDVDSSTTGDAIPDMTGDAEEGEVAQEADTAPAGEPVAGNDTESAPAAGAAAPTAGGATPAAGGAAPAAPGEDGGTNAAPAGAGPEPAAPVRAADDRQPEPQPAAAVEAPEAAGTETSEAAGTETSASSGDTGDDEGEVADPGTPAAADGG